MMFRAAATDPFSLGDAAAVLVGLLVVGAVVFCVSMCAEDSPLISDFLHRTQTEADASRFHELLGALNEPHQGPHLLASAERSVSHASQTASQTNAVPLAASPTKREEIDMSDRGGGSDYRSEIQAIYDREIASGGLKPRQAVRTAGRNAADL